MQNQMTLIIFVQLGKTRALSIDALRFYCLNDKDYACIWLVELTWKKWEFYILVSHFCLGLFFYVRKVPSYFAKT